jgi:hypothetical protein
MAACGEGRRGELQLRAEAVERLPGEMKLWAEAVESRRGELQLWAEAVERLPGEMKLWAEAVESRRGELQLWAEAVESCREPCWPLFLVVTDLSAGRARARRSRKQIDRPRSIFVTR